MPPTSCDPWIVEHGGAVDGLVMRGAALVTTAAVKKGRQLASLPRSVLLSSEDALLPETGLGFVAERFPDLVVPPFMLALLLLLHDARGADSRLAPLLRSLPAADELQHLPIFMSSKRQATLKGTDAAALLDELQQELGANAGAAGTVDLVVARYREDSAWLVDVERELPMVR